MVAATVKQNIFPPSIISGNFQASVNATTHTKFYSEILKGRDQLEDLDVDGRLILE
jgi:hypothetical protein